MESGRQISPQIEKEAVGIVKQAVHAFKILNSRRPLADPIPKDGIVADEDGACVINNVSPDLYSAFDKNLRGTSGDSGIDTNRLPYEYNSRTQNLKIYPGSDLVHETLGVLVQELSFAANEAAKDILPAGYKIRQHGKSRHTLKLSGGQHFMVKEPDGGLIIKEPNGVSGDFTVVVESAVSRSYDTMLQSLVAWTFGKEGVKLCVIMYLTAPNLLHDYYDSSKWLGFVETWVQANRDANGGFVRGKVHISSADNIQDGGLAENFAGADDAVTYEHEGQVIRRLVRRDCINIPVDAPNDVLFVPVHMQYILGDNIPGLKAEKMPKQPLNISMRELESDIRGSIVSMGQEATSS